MNNFKFSKSEIKNHFEKNKTIYFVLFLCLILGVVSGVVISLSKVNYLGLLNIKDKQIINFVNGTNSIMGEFWSYLFSFLITFVLVFLLSLNYYLCFFNFVIFSYQSMILFLTASAMISSYSFSGFLKILFLILPVNICFLFILMFWIVACFERSKFGAKIKNFKSSFNYNFITKFVMVLAGVVLLAILAGIIVPLLLKSAIYLIF